MCVLYSYFAPMGIISNSNLAKFHIFFVFLFLEVLHFAIRILYNRQTNYVQNRLPNSNSEQKGHDHLAFHKHNTQQTNTNPRIIVELFSLIFDVQIVEEKKAYFLFF